MPGLTRKRQAFINALVADPTISGAEAARRAGYAPESADVTASQLLGNPSIRAAVDESRAEAAQQALVSTEAIVKELASIGLRDVEEEPPPEEEMEPGPMGGQLKRTRAKSSLRYEHKLKALELLGRYKGIWKDKVEVTGRVGLEQLVAESQLPGGGDE
jgi:phage terminase small subunit